MCHKHVLEWVLTAWTIKRNGYPHHPSPPLSPHRTPPYPRIRNETIDCCSSSFRLDPPWVVEATEHRLDSRDKIHGHNRNITKVIRSLTFSWLINQWKHWKHLTVENGGDIDFVSGSKIGTDVRTKAFGNRSFSYAAPSAWNYLPREIRFIQSTTAFKIALKIHLFQSYYHWQSLYPLHSLLLNVFIDSN